ncbi:uncharacterized protein LOC120068920 [Benincasa hispida]|uniref:uncharacterized protein LOC120068920 n=1 Tax=Benincasa hispida TaxID=102211 RepID=UPI0019024806|nr:uncharacterized protein LOC120068920 [Benincasa hispida]
MDVPVKKYFPATVSCQVYKTAFVIKNKLTEEQMRLYGKTAFGPLLDTYLVLIGQTLEIVERETSSERLRELILGQKDPNGKNSSCKDVETAFEKFNFTNGEDVVKVALTLFIKTVMIGKDKKTHFDVNIFGTVGDHEVFVHYDWSSLFYERTLNSMKTIMRGKKEDYCYVENLTV